MPSSPIPRMVRMRNSTIAAVIDTSARLKMAGSTGMVMKSITCPTPKPGSLKSRSMRLPMAPPASALAKAHCRSRYFAKAALDAVKAALAALAYLASSSQRPMASTAPASACLSAVALSPALTPRHSRMPACECSPHSWFSGSGVTGSAALAWTARIAEATSATSATRATVCMRRPCHCAPGRERNRACARSSRRRRRCSAPPPCWW